MENEKSQCKYFFDPADKAANNIIVVRKLYYIHILNELDTIGT